VLVPLLVVFGIGAALLVVEFVEFLGEPVDATNEYLADLRAGRYEEAYGSLCTVTRLALSESDFVAQQQTDEQELGRITSYDITTSDVEGDGAATTRGEVVRGGRTFDYRFDLREEQDRWRMCSWSGPSAGD